MHLLLLRGHLSVAKVGTKKASFPLQCSEDYVSPSPYCIFNSSLFGMAISYLQSEVLQIHVCLLSGYQLIAKADYTVVSSEIISINSIIWHDFLPGCVFFCHLSSRDPDCVADSQYNYDRIWRRYKVLPRS